MFIRFKLQYSFALNMIWWYMTLDILWNAFFFGAKNRSLFYADPIFRKSRLSKKYEREIKYMRHFKWFPNLMFASTKQMLKGLFFDAICEEWLWLLHRASELWKFAFIVLERFSYDVAKGCRKMSKSCLEHFKDFPSGFQCFSRTHRQHLLQDFFPACISPQLLARFFANFSTGLQWKVQNASSYSITLLAKRFFLLYWSRIQHCPFQ